MKCSRIGQKMKIKGIKDILGFFLLLISLFLLGKMMRAVEGKPSEFCPQLTVGACDQDVHLLKYFPQK